MRLLWAGGARWVMGTLLGVQAAGGPEARLEVAVSAVFEEVQRLERLLSIHRPDSELSRVNAGAASAAVVVGEDCFLALELALHYAERTEGAFDPAAGSEGSWKDVQLSSADRSVRFLKSGLRLDLGALGKGYAMDKALGLMKDFAGVECVELDFGGQLVFWSREGRFEPRKVAIEDPRGPGLLETFELGANASVSTSSNAERQGHLLDPRSGRAAMLALSATVTAPNATQAEALSTALFVLGPQKARLVLERFPGVEARVFPS